jgi:NAD-dependent dihydropyrimidine dehydrogenase PreA subunit
LSRPSGDHPSRGDFTIADVLAWARTKAAGKRYNYDNCFECALCQFLAETNRALRPLVELNGDWSDCDGVSRGVAPKPLNYAVRDSDTFGALVARLEKLCPDAPVPPSEWTRLDAYMADIELASA